MPVDELVLNIRVIPRASRSEIVGVFDGVLKVRIAAPPVDGAANSELVKVLAKAFAVPRRDVHIVGGDTSKNKRVRIAGASRSAIQQVLRA
jgi:uncharacterized protein (TIGR00251 family)